MRSGTDPMRVLQVAARYFPYMGGLETHVYEMGRRLARAGHEVTVLTTDVTHRLPPFEVLEGVQIHRVRAWPPEKDYYFAPDLYRIITQGKWDLVHCQGYHNLVAPLAMLAARRARIPYIVSFHSGGNTSRFRETFRFLQRNALRPLLSQAEYLISPSKWEAEFFRQRLRLPSNQFAIIPNGSHHLSQLPETARQKKSGTLIVSVGRLERYKGHQRVIAALPEVRKKVPDVRLRIVGVGPYETALQKMAKQAGVTDCVEIRPVPSGDGQGMAELLAQADLVTLLSEHEAQGISILEALSLQRPVLVADTTALHEFAEQNLARAVALESTSEEVAAAIIQQLQQPLLPGNVELPTWDKCADDILALYQKIRERRSLCAS